MSYSTQGDNSLISFVQQIGLFLKGLPAIPLAQALPDGRQAGRRAGRYPKRNSTSAGSGQSLRVYSREVIELMRCFLNPQRLATSS